MRTLRQCYDDLRTICLDVEELEQSSPPELLSHYNVVFGRLYSAMGGLAYLMDPPKPTPEKCDHPVPPLGLKNSA